MLALFRVERSTSESIFIWQRSIRNRVNFNFYKLEEKPKPKTQKKSDFELLCYCIIIGDIIKGKHFQTKSLFLFSFHI